MLDAEASVLSKAADIEKVKQELAAIRQEHTKLGIPVQTDIAEKTVHVEQVHASHKKTYAYVRISVHDIC